LELSLTPIFKEWRHVTLVHKEKLTAETRGSDIYFMGLFGLASLAVASASIFVPGIVLRNPLFWVSVFVIDLIAILLLARYLTVLAGVSEKM
jgi:hypothetical protein